MPTEPQAVWFLNNRVTFALPAAGHVDRLSVTEHLMPYGESPPTHLHETEDEIFHVLEGRVRFRVGEAETCAGPGESLVGPKGVPHSFRVESPEGARMLVMTVGGDFEAFVRDFGRTPDHEGLPTETAPTAQMIENLAAAAARRRIAILGPPMA
ncbi:cupin domain-containing protein [Phenylobacterium sp.]|uniref:cupin domain-containing protein n=1 Tax=Phenylobacterium sp. TaxID=1871053 RepID=UPI0035AFCC7A